MGIFHIYVHNQPSREELNGHLQSPDWLSDLLGPVSDLVLVHLIHHFIISWSSLTRAPSQGPCGYIPYICTQSNLEGRAKWPFTVTRLTLSFAGTCVWSGAGPLHPSFHYFMIFIDTNVRYCDHVSLSSINSIQFNFSVRTISSAHICVQEQYTFH